MADDEKPRSPIKDAGWLALFLIVIGVIWFSQGGPSKLTSTSPFLKTPEIGPVAPSTSSEEQGRGFWEQEGRSVPLLPGESPYKEKISLRTSAARETDPQKEYLEIRTVSKIEPILITGWTLEGRQGLKIAIGKGAYLVYSAQVNPQESIFLEPNSEAIIVTGQSPIGTNFRLNICTGYFNQFQQFTPYLSEECPRVPEEDVPQNYPEPCFNFVRRLSRCRMPLSIPPETGNDCILFVNERVNYNGCVNAHKNEENFYKKEWRIYLGRDKEMWQYRDTIILRDGEGKEIDRVSY